MLFGKLYQKTCFLNIACCFFKNVFVQKYLGKELVFFMVKKAIQKLLFEAYK